ncbi:MAG: NfeD family protein [Candidatus Nanopelagicales bacterium]|nr:NfeD family protein [Candidatus Nanopelagicales bacterium]
MPVVLAWIAVAVVCVVVELLTLDLIFIMLAGGAAGAAIAAGFGAELPIQILVAAVVSVIGLLALRPMALRHLHPPGPGTATNIDAMIGRMAVATSKITTERGLVRIGGEIWSARTTGTEIIPEGCAALIQAIDGVVLLVVGQPEAPAAPDQGS